MSKKAQAQLHEAENYTVLARRCRPQQFRDLIGQEAVTQALVNALETNRVAHAYLFTGGRGVGKTSTARILAKALNCVEGPTPTPCDACEVCQGIASGEDLDVLEIDGASNRGIDEVREIRQNVQYRPARARYKIYIIDEVHMLTAPAFNALLKTLEEPPPHVKFMFATTEAQRIPLTILSRCQRFDFAGIGTARIAERLRQIADAERVNADDEALELIARRAAGSMRDAQSLLDQLLAFGADPQAGRLTADLVHRLLGTAHGDRVAALATAALAGDPARALAILAEAAGEGLQLGELIEQLLDYWRDLMVVHCAGVDAKDLTIAPQHRETLARQAASVALDTILAGLDVLSATKARLRGSVYGRVLVEMALVRLSRLENLVSLAELAQRLKQPDSGAGTARRSSPPATGASRPEPATLQGGAEATKAGDAAAPHATASARSPSVPRMAASGGPVPLTEASLQQVWGEVLRQVGPMLGSELEKGEYVAISGPNALVLRFPPRYNRQREHCEEASRVTRVEDALRRITGQAWSIRYEPGGTAQTNPPAQVGDVASSPSRAQRQRMEAMQVPLVKRALERLGAQIVQVEEGFGGTSGKSVDQAAAGAGEEA